MGDKPRGSSSSISKLVTFAEAATQASNSAAWWRKLASRGQLPVVKLGRSTRLRAEDVERVIRAGLHPVREPGQPRRGVA
jgi:hypothetical protein